MKTLIETVKANMHRVHNKNGHFALDLGGGCWVMVNNKVGDAVECRFEQDVVEKLHNAGFSVEAIDSMGGTELRNNLRLVYYYKVEAVAKELRAAIAAAGIEL